MLRSCVEATKLLDKLAIAEREGVAKLDTPITQHRWSLTELHKPISLAAPESSEGWHAKALYALYDDGSLLKGGHLHHIAYSLVEDALRLAVVS
jgi:hypothetical protein